MNNIPGLSHLYIGSLFCIGRNYSKHAQELDNKVPEEPMVFLKPASSVIRDGDTIQLPPQSKEVHHEVELVIAIGEEARNILEKDALHYIAGYGIGIDVTARDIQQQAKKRGHPWSIAKGFDSFAPLSNFVAADTSTRFDDMRLTLSVNGEMRQSGSTHNMIFSVTKLLAYLSTIFSLQPGDLIFTGTPEGVSRITPGDVISARLNNNEIELNISVACNDT